MNIKLKQNKGKGNGELPDYTINYKDKNSFEKGRDILSALIGNSDLILEVNSAQFFRGINKETCVESMIDFAKENSIKYRYRKVAASGSKNMFAQLLKSTKKDDSDHEVLFLFQNGMWKKKLDEKFRSAAPVLYYILAESGETDELLEEMQNMMDSQKKRKCRLVVFDWPEISQMGVFTKSVSFDDLQTMLKQFL